MDSSRFLSDISRSVAKQTLTYGDLVKSLNNLAREYNKLSQIDAEIKCFVDEYFSRQTSPSLSDPEKERNIAQILEIKGCVEGMRKELSLVIEYIDSNENSRKVYQEILEFKENNISNANLVPKINTLLEHVDSSLQNVGISPEKRTALERFKSSLVKYRTSIELERARAFASPLLNKPATDTVQAFATGHEPAIKGLVAMGQISKKGTTTVAPQQVTQIGDPVATDNMKKAIPFLFSYYDKCTVSLVNKGDDTHPDMYLRFTRGSERLEIKYSDWQNAALSALSLNTMQLQAYQNLILDKKTEYAPRVAYNDKTVPDEVFFAQREQELGLAQAGNAIRYPEKLAINIYTGSGYEVINNTMRGFTKGMTGEQIKEGLLHAIVIGQALPKMPDYADPQGRQYVWRGEGSNFKKFHTLDQLVESINNDQMREPAYGFTSSSFNKPSSQFFTSISPAAQLIKAQGGKNINPYSQYHLDENTTEREVLFPRGNFIYQGSWVAKEGGIDLTIFMSEFDSGH